MAKSEVTSVTDAVLKLQLYLLEGIQDENLLFAAGSLMSRSDYNDVVTERSISSICGYPLCNNPLPSERSRKGRYRISQKEHKLYDLRETNMYCSTGCMDNSRSFAWGFPETRCSTLNTAKINGIFEVFENLHTTSEKALGEIEDLGFSRLKIQENTDNNSGDVSLEEWAGPYNAVEGYVPERDNSCRLLRSETDKKGHEPNPVYVGESKPAESLPAGTSKPLLNERDFTSTDQIQEEHAASKKFPEYGVNTTLKAGSKHKQFGLRKGNESIFSDMDFMSAVITQDEYSISKAPVLTEDTSLDQRSKRTKGKSGLTKGKDSVISDTDFRSTIITQDEYCTLKTPAESSSTVSKQKMGGSRGKSSPKHARDQNTDLKESHVTASNDPRLELMNLSAQSGSIRPDKSFPEESLYLNQSDHSKRPSNSVDVIHPGKSIQTNKIVIKSSLRSSGVRKAGHSVSWADEKSDGFAGRDLCEFQELKNTKERFETVETVELDDGGDPGRLASANACARALTEAAEAVSSGSSEAADAVVHAGIILLPQPNDTNGGEHLDGIGSPGTEPASMKWPKKSGLADGYLLDSEDSWFDAPPEGFSLTLSPFATMWNTLFTWITSSSLAYIYGREESSHEEYLSANGVEYPQKIVLSDGRSSEIRKTLAGCLDRALPSVITDLKLPTPVSTLEQGLGRLLDTMAFLDALPPFRMKQWQVIVLLFIEALSVRRIPKLSSHLISRRTVIPELLEGSQISPEEYQYLKELVLPLGQTPQVTDESR